MPRLSVRIPTVNNYPGLARALESILTQDYADLDIMIVDNSLDNSDWLRSLALAERYKVPAIHNPEPGLAENWNRCVESATGEYILVFHHDDEMLPGMLRKSVEFLDAHPKAGLVHSNSYDVSISGKVRLRVTQTKPILAAGTEALLKFVTNPNMACSSVVVRRECYRRLGLFLTGNPSPDLEMWARIGHRYDIGHVAAPLVRVYGHLDSSGPTLLSALSPEEVEQQWLGLYERIIDLFPESERPLAVQRMHSAMLPGLATAAYYSWMQRRWARGQEFFALARRHITWPVWTKAYVITVLRALKHSLFGLGRS